MNIEHQGRCDLEAQMAALQDEFLHHCQQMSTLQQERDQLRDLLDEQEELGEQQRHGMQQKVDAAKMSASVEVKVTDSLRTTVYTTHKVVCLIAGYITHWIA